MKDLSDLLTLTYNCWNSSRFSLPLGQSFRKPLYHCLSSCSLNSVFFTRSSITSGVSLLFCFPMIFVRKSNMFRYIWIVMNYESWTDLWELYPIRSSIVTNGKFPNQVISWGEGFLGPNNSVHYKQGCEGFFNLYPYWVLSRFLEEFKMEKYIVPNHWFIIYELIYKILYGRNVAVAN